MLKIRNIAFAIFTLNSSCCLLFKSKSLDQPVKTV